MRNWRRAQTAPPVPQNGDGTLVLTKGNPTHHKEKPKGSQLRPYGADVVRAPPVGLDNKQGPGL
ncbi:hypothetical protein GCM10023080_018010 [Streptomyces pseudoechinosporeus]